MGVKLLAVYYMHGINAVSLLLDKHFFCNGKTEPIASLLIVDMGTVPGFDIVSVWKTCLL